MKLNKMDPWIFGVTSEQDQRMLFNSRLREAKEEATKENKINTIEKLMKIGMDISQISGIVELSVEEIQMFIEQK